MKILHIINSLNKGGAEGNLFRLCSYQKKKYKNKIKIIIITLLGGGFYETELKKIGVNIVSLNLEKNYNIYDFIKKISKLRKLIKKSSPNILQSWMYHSNFLSLFIQKRYTHKLFWNIRHSELNTLFSKKKTILISFICGLFSKFIPNKIIYNSDKSIHFHEDKFFYSKKKTRLIYNGYNDDDYYPSKKERFNFRKKYKINNSDIIIGNAGRYAKQKNISSILIAFSKIVKKYKNNVYLYMVGKNINSHNKDLAENIKKLNITDKIFFLNQQKNLLKFYNGIDFLLLASHSESFPNVVAESMLCSTPVLSSNAGDSKKIINNQGFIMKTNDIISIYKNISKVINFLKIDKKKWITKKKNSRLQIQKNFLISKMSDAYLKTWTS